MNYPELIEAYRGLKNKCFVVTETYSEQGTWSDETSVIPKVYVTIDDLIKDYPEDNFMHVIHTKDNGEEFEYEKHLLTYNKMPTYENFKPTYKKYIESHEKIYVSRYSDVLNDSVKLMSDREIKLLRDEMDSYAKEVESMLNYSICYTVIVADKIGIN